MMTDNPRYQIAQNAAGEAIEALLTVYWSDSFQVDLLQDRLAETILFFIRNARSIKEPNPSPDMVDRAGEQTVDHQCLSDSTTNETSNNASGFEAKE